MRQLTVDDIACSALAAETSSEVAACYRAAQGHGFGNLTSHVLPHPMTKEWVTLGQILAEAFLNLAPRRVQP